MREPSYTLTAGPTGGWPSVEAAMGAPLVYDYDPLFLERFARTERKVAELFRTAGDVVLMQGEAVLGLEAAARALVRPGMTALNLVSGVYAKWFGIWLAEYGANLVEVEVPYDEADPGGGRGARARGPPRDRPGRGRPLRDPVRSPQPPARDRRGRAGTRRPDARRRRVLPRGRGARRRRVGARPLRRRAPEVPRGTTGDVLGRRSANGHGTPSATTPPLREAPSCPCSIGRTAGSTAAARPFRTPPRSSTWPESRPPATS